MDITKARQTLERHKRTLGDFIKRGYIKRCEDAFADLEKTAAALPAGDQDAFRAEMTALVADTKQQLGRTFVEDARKNVQRHIKYAEDSMAKGVARNVVSARDCIVKTVDKSDGRSYFEFHESSGPFLAEIAAVYEKIDAWLAANDPAAPKPQAAASTTAVAAAKEPTVAPAASPSPAPSPTPSPKPATATATTTATAPAAKRQPATTAAVAAKPQTAGGEKKPEYKRLDDGAFLPVFDTSPATGLPRQVLSFLPSMVNCTTKQCNTLYAKLVAFVEEAIAQCATPFDIKRKKHELDNTVPNLLDKIEQLEKSLPKAQAVDAELGALLQAAYADARAKVTALVDGFEAKAQAAGPLLEVKTQLKTAAALVALMEENQDDTGVVYLRESGLSEYNSSAGVRLRELWGVLGKILAKAQAASADVAQSTGAPYDLATAEPRYNEIRDAAIKAYARILSAQLNEHIKYESFGSAGGELDLFKAALAEHTVPEARAMYMAAMKRLLAAMEAHDARVLAEAQARQVPLRRWSGGDDEAEQLEKAAFDLLTRDFIEDGDSRTLLIVRLVGGDWAVIKRNLLGDPIQWNALMAAVFFEDPARGSAEPRLGLFHVGPVAREGGGRALPFVDTTVVPGGDALVVVDNLPEPFKTEIGAKFAAWEREQEEITQRALAAAAASGKCPLTGDDAVEVTLDVRLQLQGSSASRLRHELLRRGVAV